MAKIVLTAINARYVHSNPAVLYLKKAVEDIPRDVVVREFSINESPEKIILQLKEEKADVIAISVYIWNSILVRKLLPELKRNNSSLKIILGGPEVSYNALLWLDEHPEIDYIITGGGEAAFRELALSGFSSEEKIIRCTNLPFSEIVFPYDDNEMKRLDGRFIYYESSRGCPFRCSYCLSSRSDQSLDFRDLEQVRSELDFFRVYRPKLVKFVDRTFNSKREHYRGIWDYILNNFRGSDTRFHFEIYPDLLDFDDLRFLATVPEGLFQLEMGIQSLKGETLAAINRGCRKEGWLDKVKTIADMGNIHVHVDLIAGLPYESYPDFMNSFDTVHNTGADHFQCGFLKVLPGTEMREKSGEFGLEYSPLPPYQIESSRWISRSEIGKLERIADLLEIYYNSGRFRETEKYLTGFYSSPFEFYESLSEFSARLETVNLREWDGAAELLLGFAAEKWSAKGELLTDYLRWDWCISMKMHHFPKILKSDATVNAKRQGYNYVSGFSDNGVIKFRGFEFGMDELRRSIFFRPESREFNGFMDGMDFAMFLPDKRVICFAIE